VQVILGQDTREDRIVATEIERKYLVSPMDWSSMAEGVPCRQGYLLSGVGVTVRVRVAGSRAFLTVKGPEVESLRREFEYAIPVPEARQMLIELCEKPIIEKTRYPITFSGHTWEVDVFHGDNEGLVLAEVELGSRDEPVELPLWVTDEVTGDPRYYNVSLVKEPYRSW
jgi:CYTH domain-containing protein